MEIAFPTLLPSPFLGITGAITGLKKPPKTNTELFDFAIAGPLAGMACSVLTLCVGLFLTSHADAAAIASFPQLGLGFLRQSQLGGAVIEQFLPNSLFVPSGAESIMNELKLSLHPLAIGGYMGMFINAMSLFPYGRTDGGRISTAISGRGLTTVIGNIAILSLMLGAFLDDYRVFLVYLFTYYFFQGELEIPAENEVDDISDDRKILGIAAICVGLATILPM
eukprot:CAMPEP_0118705196 /NCGR_PEP_ID=MMETSP0800-20121206/19724_1 /TAXON_ID=210618 ORGANISM="Striatella unipunctata, Strain CCMP2910" /NCGR_SAMPLE_ID=MMETSP0800 /ASSEMBLY_ACC=CAM_ASM_000638 /LENGTH=222 /DNA_ID=CAMNT_0006607305 /DNA_START=1 /DNA_END=669 /DNA_ORIENTATION=-